MGFATSARTMAAGDRRSDHQAVTLVTRHIIMDVYAHTAMLGWRLTGVTLWGKRGIGCDRKTPVPKKNGQHDSHRALELRRASADK